MCIRDRRKAASKLEVPRIGVRFRLPAEMNQVEYFGRGPEENYIDRNAGTLIDLYKTTADQMYFSYVRPQENGHHTDTRWLTLNTKGGKGLTIYADKTIGFNALRNSVEDFDGEETVSRPYQWLNRDAGELVHDESKAKDQLPRKTHINDITPRNFVEVCVDMKPVSYTHLDVYKRQAYIHNLEDFWPYYWNNWRMDYNQNHRGDVYATHGMGPACQLLDIHRGDKMNYLVSMDTKAVNGPAYIKKTTGKEVKDFQNGDQTSTLIRTEKGKTILIQHNVMTPRPYSRMYQVDVYKRQVGCTFCPGIRREIRRQG